MEKNLNKIINNIINNKIINATNNKIILPKNSSSKTSTSIRTFHVINPTASKKRTKSCKSPT